MLASTTRTHSSTSLLWVAAESPRVSSDEPGDERDGQHHEHPARGRGAAHAGGGAGGVGGRRGAGAAMLTSNPWRRTDRAGGPRGRRGTRGGRSSCFHPGSISAPIVCATPRITPPARVPQSEPRPADHDGFERVDQQQRSVGRCELRLDPVEHAGERDRGAGEPERDGVDHAVVDAHQPRRFGIVAGRPERLAEAGPGEEQRECAEHGDGDAEAQQREPADREIVGDLDRRRRDVAGLRARVVWASRSAAGGSGSRSTGRRWRRSGTTGRRRRAGRRRPVGATQPAANPSGTMITSSANGFQPVASTSVEQTKAAAIAMSPWLRLMILITPNASDRPVAYERVEAADEHAGDQRVHPVHGSTCVPAGAPRSSSESKPK